jgi:hypothetical protein
MISFLYSFSEQESGSKKNRVELNKTIQACKDNKAVLLTIDCQEVFHLYLHYLIAILK